MTEILHKSPAESAEVQTANHPNYSALDLMAQAKSGGNSRAASDGPVKAEPTALDMTPIFAQGKESAQETDRKRDRDAEKAFSLGVQPVDRAQLFKNNPTLNEKINDLTEDSVNPENVQYKGMDTSVGVETYKAQALGQMVAKYGEGRVGEMFDALQQSSRSHKVSDYSLDLKLAYAKPTGINDRLHILADLCEPGGVERLRELTAKLNGEGYTKTLGLDQMNGKTMALLNSKAEERKAFIAFENLTRTTLAPVKFLSEHPQYSDKNGALPSERMRAFEKWQAHK